MIKAVQIQWSKYQKLLIDRKLFTVLLWFLWCNNIFGQIYVGEGTTLIVENKTFTCENSVARITENFSEIHIADDSLYLAVNAEVSIAPSIKSKKKQTPRSEVKKNKMTEVPAYNFSSGSNQHFASVKKNGNFAMVLIQNPTLLAPFQTMVHPNKDLTFSGMLPPRKLSEQYKNKPLYSSSVIRPPPLEDTSAM